MSDTFRNRLCKAMSIRNVKAIDLVRKTGLSKPQLSQYINGICEAKQAALYKLAVALDVSEAWLMGYDVDMQRVTTAQESNTIEELIKLHYGKDALYLLQLISSLNDQGIKKVVDTAADLNEIPKYLKPP